MKRITTLPRLLALPALIFIAGGSALAQSTVPHPEAGPGVPAPARTEEISTAKTTTFSDGSAVQNSKLELRSIPPARVQNRVVVDASGTTVGTVERVVEDKAGKGIRYLVLSDEEHKYIVPGNAFTLSERDHELTLQLPVEPAKLANAPVFVESRMTDYSSRETAQPVYSYWNTQWED